MKKITVIIVDDHKLIREMWALMLAGNNEIEVTGESENLVEAVKLIKAKTPDIVLLDINFPNASGLDAISIIQKISPGTRIIGISMYNQPAYAKKMLQLGAKAYITKNSSCEEIFKAIEKVMKGGVYVCKEIIDVLADHIFNNAANRNDPKELSMREIEVIKFIKDGFSSKEISSKLSISIGTVESHRHNILKKLNLKNTASLINFTNTTNLCNT